METGTFTSMSRNSHDPTGADMCKVLCILPFFFFFAICGVAGLSSPFVLEKAGAYLPQKDLMAIPLAYLINLIICAAIVFVPFKWAGMFETILTDKA